MSNGRLSIRISEQLQGELEALAEVTGKSESDLVREAIEEYCQKHALGPSCHDIAKKAGWFGRSSKLPKDLSTNKKYMEGFGRD
jgi:hypothetical protein